VTVSLTITEVGMGASARDTAQLNGWSCGCSSSSSGGSGVLLLLGGLLFASRRRRAVSAAVVVAGALALWPVAANAAPDKARKTKTSPAPAAAPAPVAAPAPTPAPVAAPTPAPEPTPAPAPVVVAPPAPQGPQTLVLLGVVVTVTDEKLDASAFYDIAFAAIEGSKLFKVMGMKEISTLLGVERQRQLLGCSESSCFTELAGALGARYVLQSTVGKVGSDYVVSVRLLDSVAGKPAGSGTVQTSDANLLLNSMWNACQDAIDAAANTMGGEEGARWKARPKEPPARAAAPPSSRLGVAISALGGYQPLAAAGSRITLGGEIDVSWRISRFDLGAGLVVSPVPGLRLFASFALIDLGPSRLAVAVRGSGFFGSNVYGGGVGVTYEFAFNRYIAAQAGVAADFYSGGNPVIVALLGGLGVAAHF